MSVMLYKHPGPHDIHGDKFDYIIVDESEVDQSLNDGWSLTTTDALPAEPTGRELLEAKAAELGIKFKKNTANKTLEDKILKAEEVAG